MKIMTRALFPLLAASGMLGSLPLLAAEASQDPEGEVKAGLQWYADRDPNESAKFLEYRDVPNGFVMDRLIFSWQPKERYFFDLDAIDLVQKDQRVGFEFGKRDLWKAAVRWQENPRRWTDRAKMLYTDQGAGVFTLEDTLQSAIQAAPASTDADADGQWDAGTKGAIVKEAIRTSADDVFVGFQRKTGGAGVEFTPTRSLTFDVQADRERRSGTTPQSLGMYFQLSPSEVAAPVDFKTDTASVGGEFTRKSWNLGARLTASNFETGFKSLTWDDQLFLSDTAAGANADPARGRLTLWTDSELRQGMLYGGVDLPGRTRINATFSRSVTTQDDPFLPKTTNSLLAPAPLPRDSLDGEYRDTVADVRASGRPLGWLRWGAWWRDADHDNRTPSLLFRDYVMTDYAINKCSVVRACDANGDGVANDPIQRRNLPFGYERQNLGGLIGFTPLQWFEGSIGYEREKTDRQFSAAESADEDIWKLTLDFDVASWLSLRSTFRTQERRVDEYDPEYFVESFPIGEPNVAAINEGERKFIWTDRDRDSIGLMADVTPFERLSFYGEVSWYRDKYFDPNTGKPIGDLISIQEDRDADGVDETYDILLGGRTHDRSASYTLGVSAAPVKRFDIYADYTWEIAKYGLASRYRCPGTGAAGSCATGATFVGVGSDRPVDDWGSDAKDRYRTTTLGFNASLTKEGEWTAAGSFSHSLGKGDIHNSFVPGGFPSGDTTLTDFPVLKNALTIATLGVTHRIRKDLDYGLSYWYEKWHEDNWASDFMQPYMGDPNNDPGSVTAVYLGMDYFNYTNHIVNFFLRYRY